MEVYLANAGVILLGVAAGAMLMKRAHAWHDDFLPGAMQLVRDYNDVRFYYKGRIVGEPVDVKNKSRVSTSTL